MSVPNLMGGPLEDRDYQALEQRWITRDIADGALLRRVNSIEGAEIVGATGRGGNYAGIVISYVWPGDAHVRTHRIRRDQPDLEADHAGAMKTRRKYMGPPGRGNALYLPPQADASMVDDVGLPAVVVEGEFKALALWRLAWHGLGDAAESPAFLPIGLQGVYSWRGKIGRAEGAEPQSWVDVKGPVPELGRIAWSGRRVIILFDANVEDVQNHAQIGQARRELTRELEARGAEVSWFKWPPDVPAEVNGIDDYLAARGPAETIRWLAKARKVTRKRKVPTVATAIEDAAEGEDWRRRLIRNEKGGIKALVANAITFLSHADELQAMLSFDEFAVRTMALAGTPWNPSSREWGEVDDIRLAEWLQHKGCPVSDDTAAKAVAAVSRERSFHPVREYLSKLEWDKRERIDTWLRDYLGVGDTKYSRAVGARWLISAVARVMQPACQADHCLILEGPQGRRKSSALRVLAGEWFTDQVGDLSQKDAAQQIHGVWIVEFAELEQVVQQRAEAAVVKAFITRRVDRFRPPYERRPADFPRQCVFAGSVNLESYLRDETGGRRFWSVRCGEINVPALERDRDQLWAEARARFEAGAVWWLDDPELVDLAAEEQEARYELDPWDEIVWGGAEGLRSAWQSSGSPVEEFKLTIEDVLRAVLKMPEAAWQHAHRLRIGRILRRHGLIEVQRTQLDADLRPVLNANGKTKRPRFYVWPEVGEGASN